MPLNITVKSSQLQTYWLGRRGPGADAFRTAREAQASSLRARAAGAWLARVDDLNAACSH